MHVKHSEANVDNIQVSWIISFPFQPTFERELDTALASPGHSLDHAGRRGCYPASFRFTRAEFLENSYKDAIHSQTAVADSVNILVPKIHSGGHGDHWGIFKLSF